MDAAEQARFERLYQQHLLALKTQGKRPKTIDAYSRALRRLRNQFDCCPDANRARDNSGPLRSRAFFGRPLVRSAAPPIVPGTIFTGTTFTARCVVPSAVRRCVWLQRG